MTTQEKHKKAYELIKEFFIFPEETNDHLNNLHDMIMPAMLFDYDEQQRDTIFWTYQKIRYFLSQGK